MHHSTLLRTESGQCQVFQDTGKAELQFSVSVVVTPNVDPNPNPNLYREKNATLIGSFLVISEAQKSEASMMGQEMLDIFYLSSWVRVRA